MRTARLALLIVAAIHLLIFCGVFIYDGLYIATAAALPTPNGFGLIFALHAACGVPLVHCFGRQVAQQWRALQ